MGFVPQCDAVCRLAGEVVGVGEDELLAVDPPHCAACRSYALPTPEHPNPAAASAIHLACERIVARGGVDGCDEGKARRLMAWAAAHLQVVSLAPEIEAEPLEPWDGPCFYLGGGLDGEGEREEPSAGGREAVFACRHERHRSTTEAGCRACPDYDRALVRGGVRTWAVGVVTAPRAEATLGRSLESLARAGWREGIVFAEPGTPRPVPLGGRLWSERVLPMGAWPNWLLALEELTLRFPRADAYLICQDDVLYAGGLRRYLEEALWPESPVGVVSLHTASHQDRDAIGFGAADLGWSAWGAQAYVFPNAATRAFLRHPLVRNHRHRGPGQGVHNVDSVVGAWCRASGLPYILHGPSLTQHIGETSALWDRADATGRRRAASFPGEDVDIGHLMAARGGAAKARSRSDAEPAPEPQPVRPVFRSLPDDLWGEAGFVIGSPLVGRRGPLERWSRWLLEADLPARVALRLVDNSGDDAGFAALLGDVASHLRASGRFDEVAVSMGPGPAPAGPRFSLAKHESVAAGYNAALRGRCEEMALILDCDVIPPRDGLRVLVDAFARLRRRGVPVGAISGCCESAAHRGSLAACRSRVDWRRRLKVGEPGPGEIVEIGFVGTAFLLVDNRLLQSMMPLGATHMSGMVGPDGFLCDELRLRGFGAWLHGDVVCEHLIDAH